MARNKNSPRLSEMNNQEKLEQIRKNILENTNLALRESAANLVFGKGNSDAEILIIGEAPGEKEDLQGIPFVGRAGKELDKLLHMINISLEEVYIANILKYRPPKNRDPKQSEIEEHTPYLIEQIMAIQPKVIVTLGNFATKFVLAGFDSNKMKEIEGIAKVRGTPVKISLGNSKFTVIPIYHPAAILYRPAWREQLEKDFQKIGQVLQEKDKYRGEQ
ncbi:MAG: uracil-DNA glycosylase [archaeon]|nr:uracil-DNA glycosylase [archaeon]